MTGTIDGLLQEGRRMLTLPAREFRAHIEGTRAALIRAGTNGLVPTSKQEEAHTLAGKLGDALKADNGYSFPGSTAVSLLL